MLSEICKQMPPGATAMQLHELPVGVRLDTMGWLDPKLPHTHTQSRTFSTCSVNPDLTFEKLLNIVIRRNYTYNVGNHTNVNSCHADPHHV